MVSTSASTRVRAPQRIEAGTRINGDVLFTGSIEVAGRISGALLAEPVVGSAVVILEQGRVVGPVHAESVRVAGECIGPLTAERELIVDAGGRIEGEIRHRSVDIAHGAFVGGNLLHLDGDGQTLPLRAVARDVG